MSQTPVRRYLCLFSLLLIAVRSSGNPASWLERQYALGVWETDDGLPHNSVNTIIQRSDGFLWIATSGGIARFDGLRFLQVRSPLLADVKSSATRCAIEEDSETLLIASDTSGLLRFKNGALSVHPATAELRDTQKISYMFREADGVFWVAFADRKLCRWDHGRIEMFPPPAIATNYWPVSFARSRDGKVYVARGSGIERYENGQIAHPPGLPVEPACICAGRAGGIWIGTADRLLLLDSDDVQELVANPPPWSGPWPPNVLLESHDGALWIGTRGEGVLHWKAGKTFSPATSHRRINDLCEDDEGNLWAATAGGGLNRLQRSTFLLLDAEAGLSGDVASGVCEDAAGDVWFANRNGIHRIHDRQVDAVSLPDDWPKGAIPVCPDHSGNVWIGSGTKLYRVKAGSSEGGKWLEADGVGNIHVVFTARDGSIWAGGEGGPVVRYRGDLCDTFGPEQGFIWAKTQAFGESTDGHIWIGTERGELVEFDGARFAAYTKENGLPGSAIRAIYGDAQGRLWIGTSGGGLLVRHDGGFSRITQDQGLPDNFISQILEDDFGALWFGSSRGLFKIPKANLVDCASGRTARVSPLTYGKPDGLAGFSAVANYQPTAWKSASGELWFATRKGLVTTDLAQQRISRRSPHAYIERFLVDGQDVDLHQLRIPSSSKRLEFHFAAPAYRAPEKLLFRYRMEGLDAEWIDGGTQRFAIYPKLPPNRYLFQVAACNSEGVWNPEAATLAFDVLPAWWERWWAQGAAVLLGGAALAAMVRYWSHRRLKARLARLEQEQRIVAERTRIARDLHDGIGAGLTHVGMVAEELQEDCADLDAVKEHSSQLVTRVRNLARDLDAVVWAVSPTHDTLAALAAYVCQFALEYFRNTPIRCLVHTAQDIPDTPISPEARHHLFLIAKEAMNNALKHSHATQSEISMQMSGDSFELVIADNGTGFHLAEAEASGRNGLQNMRARASAAGGMLDIQTSSVGTAVKIHLPVPSAASLASAKMSQ